MRKLQILEVRHLPATNTKGSRCSVKNTVLGESMIVYKDYQFDSYIDQLLSTIDPDIVAGISYSKLGVGYIVIDPKDNYMLSLKNILRIAK